MYTHSMYIISSGVSLVLYICIYTHIYIHLVGPGNSLGVSVAFPSFTFPLRFRYVSVNVSVAFPSTFPSRFRWAIACPTNAALKFPQRQQNQQ